MLTLYLRGGVTRRREAILLFREISKCIPDAYITKISLNQEKNEKEEFELRINVIIQGEHFESVQSIVNKRGLNLKEDHGSLLIYEPKAPKIEIANI